MDDGKYVYVKKAKEFFEEDETITNHEVMDILELKKRWVGATDEDIVRQNRIGNLPVYKVCKINRTPRGEIERVLHLYSISIGYKEDENGYIDESVCVLYGEESLCLLPDVINVEKCRPDFLHEIITPHKEESPSHPLVGEATHIGELEAQLTAALQRAGAAEQALAKAQEQLAAAPQEVGTVDAALWENSLDAACTVLVGIMDNGEVGITKDNFGERMRDASPNKRTHTKADRLAWKKLPDRHKAGPGRPKK